MPIRTIIFDVDGVLCDTFEFHRIRIAEFVGTMMSVDDFRNIHNGNFFETVPQEIKDTDWRAYAKYIYHEQSALLIVDATKKSIKTLSESYALHLVSSGSEINIEELLRNNGLHDHFNEILGLESHRLKIDKFKFLIEKYHLHAEECLFVTDTLGDILESNEVNIPTIAVDFGYHDTKTLQRGNPLGIISHFDEIELLLQGLSE